MKGVAKEHIYIPIDRENSVLMARGKEQGWVEVGKGGEMGTYVTVSTIKIKKKIRQ